MQSFSIYFFLNYFNRGLIDMSKLKMRFINESFAYESNFVPIGPSDDLKFVLLKLLDDFIIDKICFIEAF